MLTALTQIVRFCDERHVQSPTTNAAIQEKVTAAGFDKPNAQRTVVIREFNHRSTCRNKTQGKRRSCKMHCAISYLISSVCSVFHQMFHQYARLSRLLWPFAIVFNNSQLFQLIFLKVKKTNKQKLLDSFSSYIKGPVLGPQRGAARHRRSSQGSCAHLWAAEGSSAPAGSGGCPSGDSGSPDAGAAPRGRAELCRCRTSGSLRGSLQFGSFYTGAQWKTWSRRTEGEAKTQREKCIEIFLTSE